MDINKISLIIPVRNCNNLETVNNKNANAGKNRNLGSEKAQNEYLFFLDSDCLPTDDLINELPLIKFNENKIITGYYSEESTNNLISDTLSKFIKFRLKNQKSKCIKFSSANFIIGKDFFKRIGKFNEHLDCYEDVDLNVRANLFKAEVESIEKFSVIHLKLI